MEGPRPDKFAFASTETLSGRFASRFLLLLPAVTSSPGRGKSFLSGGALWVLSVSCKELALPGICATITPKFRKRSSFHCKNKLRKRQPPQKFRKRKDCGGFLFAVCWIHLLVKNSQIYQFTFGNPKPNAHAKRPIFARILRNTVTLIK